MEAHGCMWNVMAKGNDKEQMKAHKECNYVETTWSVYHTNVRYEMKFIFSYILSLFNLNTT